MSTHKNQHQVPATPGVAPLPDVLQEPAEPLDLTVKVKHDGPLTTQELPAVLGTTATLTVTVQPQVALSASPLRKRAILISTDNPFLIVSQRNNASVASACALWPANVPFEFRAQSALSVATSSGTASVSVVTEDWSR